MAKMNKNLNNAKETLDELVFASRDFTDEVQKAAKATFGVGTQARETLKAFRSLSKITEEVAKDVEELVEGTQDLSDIQKKQNKILDSRKKLQLEFNQSLGDSLKHGRALNKDQSRLLLLFNEQFKVLDDLEGEMGKMATHAKNVENNMGLTGSAFRGIEGIMKKMGAGNLADRLGFDEAIKGGREYSAQLETGQKKAGKLGKKFSVAGNMVKSLGKNLIKSLGPIGIIVSLVNMIVGSFMKLDKLSADTAKNLGISYNSAKDLVMEMNEFANSAEGANVTTAQLVESQNKLNNMFGTSVKFSTKMAAEFALVQERLGLSEESMMFFQKTAIKSGKTLKQQLQVVSDTTMELNAQTGLNLSNKQVMEGVAKASSRMVLSTKEGVKGLTKSLFAAKQMGIEFSQIEAMMDSMLDFESSIANEMEAELLTGKSLNLEKARTAALNNDMETFTKEIAKNIGTSAEFSKMNRIQQEAIAKSVGMTANDLADSLKKQEALEAVKKAGFDSAEAAQDAYNKMIEDGMSHEEALATMKAKGIDDTLTAQMESQSKSEKMAKISEKFSDMFMGLADAFMPLIEMLVDVLSFLMTYILNPIIKLITGIVELIGQAIGEVIDFIGMIASAIGDIFSPIVDAFVSAWEGATSIVMGMFEAIGNFFSTIIDGIVGAFEYVFDIAKSIFKTLIGIVLAPFQFIADVFVGLINFIIEGVNDIITTIPGVTPFSLMKSPDLMGMVGLAEGGVVTGPTNALIGEGGEPEAVVPLSKAESMGFGGKETNQLLKRILTTLEKGGTVELNGQKVGEAMALTNYSTQ